LRGSRTHARGFDANGNRTGAGYVIGADNELLCDGTYTYTYDAEGNRTAKFIDTNADGVLDSGDTSVTIYGWDNRNRLVSVTSYAAYGDAPTQAVTYSYDAENRWIGETVINGDGSVHTTAFGYDPGAGGGGGAGTGQIVLQFDKDVPSATGSASALTVNDLSHRYLWGPAVDQILADEQVSPLPRGEGQGEGGQGGGYNLTQPGTVVWPLTDNLGTVRDLAAYNAATGQTSVASHRVYDSFGNLKSQTNAAVDCLFGFTGEPLDPAGTGLQNNGQRWYEAGTGGWLSQDPTGLSAGDTNLYRYCGNSPGDATDPTGEWPRGWRRRCLVCAPQPLPPPGEPAAPSEGEPNTSPPKIELPPGLEPIPSPAPAIPDEPPPVPGWFHLYAPHDPVTA
jgi:RHS repeat-associated protein